MVLVTIPSWVLMTRKDKVIKANDLLCSKNIRYMYLDRATIRRRKFNECFPSSNTSPKGYRCTSFSIVSAQGTHHPLKKSKKQDSQSHITYKASIEDLRIQLGVKHESLKYTKLKCPIILWNIFSLKYFLLKREDIHHLLKVKVLQNIHHLLKTCRLNKIVSWNDYENTIYKNMQEQSIHQSFEAALSFTGLHRFRTNLEELKDLDKNADTKDSCQQCSTLLSR